MAHDLEKYAQRTSLGVPVIPGMLTRERAGALKALWPRISDVAARWRGVAFADIGRLQLDNWALPMARAAAAVVLVCRQSTESLYRLRERILDAPTIVGAPASTPQLCVVLSGPAARSREALRDGRTVLDSVGASVPIVGYLPLDGRDLDALWNGVATRRLVRGALLRAATGIATELGGLIRERDAAEALSVAGGAS
jgi:hypothetical protein